jgi:isochorismate hydrolase
MSLPMIKAYPMPGPDRLPTSRVRWRPHRDRAALLVHDMQHYFVDALPGGAEPAVSLIANVSRLIAAARRAAVPVLYTAQPGDMSPSERGLLMDVWGPGMTAEPAHRAIVPEAAPAPGEPVLTKWRYSAFHGSDLADRLAAAGRDQLAVCGVYAHLGCLATVTDAFCRDIQPFLVGDAVADFSLGRHEAALRYAADYCASVISSDALLTAVDADDLESVGGRR